MASLKAVLCDIDGTLIDSNPAHAEAWLRTFEHFGIPATYDQVLHQIGKGSDHLIPHFVPVQSEREQIEEKLKTYRKNLFHRDYIGTIQPFPKVRQLLQRMRENNLIVAVASSSDKQDLPLFKKIAQIEDLVEKDTSAADAKHSKPDPDIFQAAMGKVGLRPQECIALGDTPWDIEAASKAGVPTIAVTSGGWTREQLSNALAIYEDVADLYRNYDSSPLAQ